ncbi:uncharacterized protein [Thunnus thynnus]|uniref:uncharacterized protein isoform X1 n=1 Tax=Thunnus thynnus TaxID=8237 RepID=UPI00352849C4
MMRVLLLLSACVCLGLADGRYVEEQYGKMFRWMIPEDTRSLEFTPKGNSEVTVLWTRHVKKGMDPAFSALDHKPLKGKVDLFWGFICCYYELSYLTLEDSGLYTMRDKDKKLLLNVTIEVIANTRSYELSPGQRLGVTFDLTWDSCNIYFIPESDPNVKGFETEIVRQGRLERKELDKVNCGGFQLSQPCGILIERFQSSCVGRFEVRDQNDITIFVASLEVKHRVDPKTTTKGLRRETVAAIASGVFFFLSSCCGCLKKCCGESSSREDDCETEGAAGTQSD